MSEIPDGLRYEATTSFVRVLDGLGCTLAISVYMADRVVLVSAEGGRLFVYACPFSRPMGMAIRRGNDEVRIAIATFQELVVLADAPLLAPALPGHPDEYRHLLVPRATIYTGDIDAHDLVWLGDRLFVANTRFSCIAEIDARNSFMPVWQPPFITRLMPEDRCHLNGLAAANNAIVYATALGSTDVARAWTEARQTGGVLLAVPGGAPVLEGLCLPHSPRVFDDRLYVLESGTGRALEVDVERRAARTLVELPGFTRGLDRLGDILFVGTSRVRQRPGAALPVAERHGELVCGIAAIDRKAGRVLGWLRFDDPLEEIFDVRVLPKIRRGAMLGVDSEMHRRALVLPGRAFWGEPVGTNTATEATSHGNEEGVS